MIDLKNVYKQMLMSIAIISLLVVGTNAAFPDQDKIENETAVSMNVALNIIKGREDGKFDPEGTATRAEMAKMICMILNRGNELVWGTAPTSHFRDAKGHWAEAYIEYCSALGIVSGMGDGTFNPNGKVTGTHAAKMLLIAMGYDAEVEGFTGANWSFRINTVAYQKELYDKLEIDPNEPLCRDDAAQMIWNALNAPMVKYSYGVTSVDGVLQGVKVAEDYSDHRTLLSDRFQSASYEGQLETFSYNEARKEWTYEIVNASGQPASMIVTSMKDYTSLYGQSVQLIYKQNGTSIEKVYGIVAEENDVLCSGVLKDLLIKSDSLTFEGKVYKLDQGTAAQTKAIAFAYNTAFSLNPGTALDAITSTQKTYSFKAVDNDEDGKVDFLLTYPYTVQKVSFVGTTNITAGASYQKKDCEVYDGIAKGDYTKITAASNTAKGMARLEAVDKLLSGTVTKVRGSDYYIDGELFALTNGVSMTVGDTVKRAVVVNQTIFFATVSSLSMEDYALVIDAVASSDNGLYGNQAKLLLTDGTRKIVTTTQSYTDAKGALVTSRINRDGEYELSKVSYAITNESLFDKAITAGGDKITSSGTSDKVKYIDQCLIDEDAVIFVREGDGSAAKPFAYRVMTGLSLMSTNKTGLSLLGAFADQVESSGFYSVKLAYISSSEVLKAADWQYGYALDDYALVKNQYNETVYEYTLWDGHEERIVLAEYGLQTTVSKGDVLAYTLNEDGFIDQLTVYKTKGEHPAAEVSSITGYDGVNIQFKNDATIYKIESQKTKIFYIDNEDERGLKTGSIQIANEDGDGNYVPNALVLTAGNDVLLIVMDVKNDIVR